MPVRLSRVPGEKHLTRCEKSGTYYTYYYDPHTQRTLRVSTKERESIMRARAIAQELYREWIALLPKSGRDTRFEDLTTEILKRYESSDRKRTREAAVSPINHLLKTFKGVRVMDITKECFYSKHVPRAKAENPNRNLNPDRKLFIQVMYQAFQKGLIRQPPVGIPKPSIEKDIGRELSNIEISDLFRWCGSADLKLQIEIALKTGMRLREMLSLKWEYFDWGRGTIKLPPSLTKTKRGREFPLCKTLLLPFLDRYNKAQESEFVFPSPNDPEKPQFNNKTAWKTLKRRAEVKARWHDLRHTAATRKLRAGVPKHIISLEMGMGVGVLTRIYSHLNVEDLRVSAEAVKLDFLETA